MERQRKREKRPRLRFQLDKNEQTTHEVSNIPPLNIPKAAEHTPSSPLHTSPNSLNNGQNGLFQTSVPPVGPSPVPSAPHPPSGPSEYGNAGGHNNGYNLNTMGGLVSSQTYGLNYWNHECQGIPGHLSIYPTIQYHSPTAPRSQGHAAPTPALGLPGSSSHTQHPIVSMTPFSNLPRLPSDGELLRILVKSSGLSTMAKLDLRYETSFIQSREVKAQNLTPYTYKIPVTKRRVYTLPQGAQCPTDFVQICLDTLDYAFKNLDLVVQMSLDDDTDVPIRLGRGFLRKILTSMGHDAAWLPQLLPFIQSHPDQMQPIMTPSPACFDSFTGIFPLRPFHIAPANFVTPAYSMQNMTNPANIELAPSYDSISPSLQPSRQSWEVETLSSVTTPLDTTISWDDFNALNTPLDLTEHHCAGSQVSSTSKPEVTPQPPASIDLNANDNR